MTRITAIRALDIRFPTSRSLDGSDAMNLAPDYSAAYVILETDGPHRGHGLTFTIGRGNEICVAAIQSLAPMVVGLTISPERLIQIRRNRLLSLNQAPETAYVDSDKVQEELAFARRMFADNGWPVIDVTRRSIEETAAAIIQMCNERTLQTGMP